MSEGHFNQGEAYYRAGEWSKARTEFQASYEISRLDLLLFNIAQTYIKEGDSVRAIAALKAYLKTTPSDADAQANYNQFEREMTSERTSDALQYMKAQGIRLGHAPYGYEHGAELDGNGRRRLVSIEREQGVIGRIKAMHGEGLKFNEITRRLNAERIPARRGGPWSGLRISIILRREGVYPLRACKAHGPRVPLRHDKLLSAARALELRAEGMTLREIGVKLRKESLCLCVVENGIRRAWGNCCAIPSLKIEWQRRGEPSNYEQRE